MIKISCLTALLFCICVVCHSQQVSHIFINSITGSFQGQEINVSLTIGELVVDQFDFGSISLGSGSAIHASTDLVTALENDPNSLLQIYPNPTLGLLNIEFDASSVNEYKVELLNSNGKLLDSRILYETSNIELDTYPQGIYLVKIQNLSTGVITGHKIMKR